MATFVNLFTMYGNTNMYIITFGLKSIHDIHNSYVISNTVYSHVDIALQIQFSPRYSFIWRTHCDRLYNYMLSPTTHHLLILLIIYLQIIHFIMFKNKVFPCAACKFPDGELRPINKCRRCGVKLQRSTLCFSAPYYGEDGAVQGNSGCGKSHIQQKHFFALLTSCKRS